MTEEEQNTQVQLEDTPEYKGQKLDSNKLMDRTYKGEDYNCDLALQHGCVVKRRCTDVLCGISFCAFTIGMIVLTFWGYANGEIRVATAPVNRDGGFCGYNYMGMNNDGYPYLYIYDPVAADNLANQYEDYYIWQYGICVSKCPESTSDTVDCSPQDQVNLSDCGQSQVYPTTKSLNVCIPNTSSSEITQEQKNAWDNFINGFKNSGGGSFMLDVYSQRWVILISIGFTIIYTLIYIKFMDYCAFCLSWFSVIIIQAALVGLGIGVYYWGQDIEQSNNYSSNATWCNFIAWTFWIFAGFYCLCLVCNLRSLRISFAVIETAGDYFAQTKRILLVPVLFFCIGTAWFFMWVFGVFCISTYGYVVPYSYTYNNSIQYKQTRMVIHEDGDTNGWLIFYMFAGIIWTMFFLISCNDFVIIVSTITWYFSRKTDHGEEGHSSVWKGFHWIYRYNLGTLAAGSLLLSVVWIIRGIFEYIGEKLHNKTSENGCAKCLLRCCMCCVNCTDRFIRYLTENAYIYAALSGDSFCTSALHSFILILKNAAKFSFVSSVANIFMYLAKISISFGVVMTSWAIMSAWNQGITYLDAGFGPLLVIFLISYLITAIFMSIYHTSSNTILQCFLVDRDIAMQQGHVDAQHTPHTLLRFLEQYNDHGEGDKEKLIDNQTNNIE